MKENFTNAGYTVIDTQNQENNLLQFLKQNYPSIIKDNEINLTELKAIAGLPIDEKTNGYGLNFVGRQVARAKYAQKTENELLLNTTLSKDIDNTQNLILKGDNLDSLKILKNHYTSKIKCIYIDPPYNTTSDEFVYPDRFNKEEAEVLGLANLSDDDMERMEFSFKTKKSHNGWLSFMYPRLLLAKDLLANDGVIFISIDDIEQANLKLLCDEIFGEENFVAKLIWKKKSGGGNDTGSIVIEHEYLLVYSKSNIANLNIIEMNSAISSRYKFQDSQGQYSLDNLHKTAISGYNYPITAPNGDIIDYVFNTKLKSITVPNWRCPESTFLKWKKEGLIEFKFDQLKGWIVLTKLYLNDNPTQKATSILLDYGRTRSGKDELSTLFEGIPPFDYPKSSKLLKHIIQLGSSKTDTILDFFAGSGTTGHAVMQLNADDGGNRKFILCQIDEPIKEDKPAYQFCIDNNLPPMISSITIERLNRASEQIKSKNEEEKNKKAKEINFDNPQASAASPSPSGRAGEGLQAGGLGYKVFDSVPAPKLILDGDQIHIKTENNDALSRIYNMIFTIGIDSPTQTPETIVQDCIYKIGTNFYLINCDKITKEDFATTIKNGKVFIDGWTASLNGTLQNYKDDVKIIF
jgi:adenine-specific DNA-methyltransferase